MARLVAERADVIPLLAEAFRAYGYEGASLSRLCEKTGLGKGSLYHFFPGGKEEMAGAVLGEISHWFERQVFQPLDNLPPVEGVAAMLAAVDTYFQSGRRICLVGAFALDDTRDRFAVAVNGYFTRWQQALSGALQRLGFADVEAERHARAALSMIQGALVLSRALGNEQPFRDTITSLTAQLRLPGA
ncbi:TetR/AcrR family transcriptional regulator [Niveispirillum sp. BGYR6]|uniref:TetR/AcrR family transcriptional regulator n=1 Tax=Niveispirillum sp. BGYR6 TaxID=2971249 RepID=UPI0022B94BD7|nr:TetR/AcrR family transcriptional regulator [Niveispirillum sp. BGYR6]MDG5497891.1 TetR/AcrR family transcriptional regulator [Niveispirillum sp. BGYR6]